MGRYTELLDGIPRGSFYDSEGYILPKLDRPHDFLFVTDSPDTVFGVFVNDVFKGTVRTAAAGDPNLNEGEVILQLQLDSGRHHIVIENDITGRRFTSYVTVREYAVWLAAYAEALEGNASFLGIDPGIESTLSATRLAEADSRHIEDAHGRLLGQANDFGAITETYRHVLRRLRQAYRLWGGKPAGVKQTVAAFTSILPFRLPREWSANWILENQNAPNYTLEHFSRTSADPFTFLNQVSRCYVGTLNDAVTTLAAPVDPPSPQRLSFTFSPSFDSPLVEGQGLTLSAAVGSTVTVTATGGPFVAGHVGEFLVIAGADNTANNGTFEITSHTSANIIEIENASGVAETTGTIRYAVSSPWTGGDITAQGVAPGGTTVTETIPATPGAAINTANTFTEITSITSDGSGSGSGSACVGVTDSAFIRLIGTDGDDPLNTPLPLTYLASSNELTWRSTDGANPAIKISAGTTSTYTLPSPKTHPAFTSLTVTPGGGYNLTLLDAGSEASNNYLWINAGKGVLRCALTTNLGGANVTDIITDINAAAQSDTRYAVANGTIDQFDAPTGGGLQTIYRNAGDNFTADLVGKWIEITGGTSASNRGQFRVASFVSANEIVIENASGVSTGTGEGAGFDFAVIAVLVSGDGYVGDTLRLITDNYDDVVGKENALTIEPWGADAAYEVLGLPRFSSATSGGARGTTTLSYTPGARLPNTEGPWTARVDRGLFAYGAVVNVAAGTGETIVDLPGQNLTPDRDFVGLMTEATVDILPGVALPDQQKVVLEFDQTYNGTTMTVFGEDANANAVEDTVAVTPGARVRTTKEFATVTRVLNNTTTPGSALCYIGLDNSPAERGWLRLSGVGGTSDGLHRIAEVFSRDSVRITHETAGAFTAGSSTHWQLWTPGHLVEVIANDTSTNQLTLADPGMRIASGAENRFIEVADEMPHAVLGKDGVGSITVFVNSDFAPATNETDYIELQGSEVPDGWQAENASVVTVPDAYFETHRTILTADGSGDMIFSAALPDLFENYGGWPVTVRAWVQQHISASEDFALEISSDDGTTWETLSTTAITGTRQPASDVGVQLDPREIRGEFIVDGLGTGLRVRIRHDGSSAGDEISVERVVVTRNISSSMYLGRGTVPRQNTNVLEEVLYVWCPDDLRASTAQSAQDLAARTALKTTLGLPEPETDARYPDRVGHIDKVVTAHGDWARAVMSRFGPSGEVLNVRGAYNDVGWNSATLTNMVQDPGIPGRLSEVIPSRVSRTQGEVLEFDVLGRAFLNAPSTQLGPFPEVPNGASRLYRNGVPLPDTPYGGVQLWRYLAADQVEIDASELDANDTYTIDYNVLMRAETAVIDLGAEHEDYLWLLDCNLYQRTQSSLATRTRLQQLTFDDDFRAPLDVTSNQDKTRATLTRDDGTTREVVPEASWNFDDGNTIVLQSGAFDPAAIFTLEYELIDNLFERQAEFDIEVRSASAAGALPAATWLPINIDDVINGAIRYHQLRITFREVNDTRDIRLGSLGFRGIRYKGSGALVPGMALT